MRTLSLKWRLTLMTGVLIALISVALNLLVSSSGLFYFDSLESYVLEFKDIQGLGQAVMPEKDFEVVLTDETLAKLSSELPQKVDSSKHGFRLYSWLITAAVTLAGGVITWFVSGRSLKPLESFSKRVESIQAQNLSDVRLSEEVPPEFLRLSRSFNAMMERLSHSFVRQRQFTASAAHELRTPLALMQSQLDLYAAGEGAQAEPAVRETLATMREQVERLSQLVRTLLDMSELQTVPRSDLISLAPLAEEILADLSPLAEQKDIRLVQQGGEARFWGSDLLICRMLFNLVENAIKYGREGGSVTVSVEQGAKEILLRVSDTGPGIPQEMRESVFEPFFRVDKARSRALGGVGLGLTLAAEIARLHGGRLSIEKSDGSGTTFLCRLPRQEP